MRLLLDSHILPWWPMASSRLGEKARQLILDQDNEILMSAASWWELSLKRVLNTLDADLEKTRHTLEARGVATISVTVEHAEASARLPLMHRDPFDHMLVAQAIAENCRLLTRDRKLAPYGSAVLLV